jgi:hypothetical protein
MTALNQIYYGAPGTGKTYSSVEDALSIVNLRNAGPISLSENGVKPFDSIVQVIRNRYSSSEYLAKTNSLYRNDRAIMWMLGYLLMPEFDAANVLSNGQAKSVGFDDSPSSWAQRSQFISQFHFVEDWRDSSTLKLNEKGIRLKNLVRDNYSVEALKSWNEKECPQEIQQAYFDVLSNEPLSEFTPMTKTFYCALRMLSDGLLYKKSESTDPTEEERLEAEKYFDLPVGTKDLKWIGQIGRIFEGLGLAKQQPNKSNDRFLFDITDFGASLIKKIVDRWKREKPELFEVQINYASALELGLIKFITFHQSYSYEEFMEGIRPNLDQDAGLTYSLNAGIFKEFCTRAKHDLNNNYVLVIDEINRGNISKIFGELITLIEPTKRLFLDEPEEPNEALLPYSKTLFGVPKNVYLIGTMNSADKSITTLDTALRRRFKFVEFSPNLDLLNGLVVSKDGVKIPLAFVLRDLNQRIEYLLDREHQIGHSYFMKVSSWDELCLCFRDEIIPLLKEYFYGDWEKIALVLGDNPSRGKSDEDKFITQKSLNLQGLFGDEQMSFDSGQVFSVNVNLASGRFSSLSADLMVKSFNLE